MSIILTDLTVQIENQKLQKELDDSLKLKHSPRRDPIEDTKKQLKETPNKSAGKGERFKKTPWGKFDGVVQEIINSIAADFTANPNAGAAITNQRDLKNAVLKELKLRMEGPKPKPSPRPTYESPKPKPM